MPPQRARNRQSAAKWIAGILAVAVHVGFVLFLIFSVNWQNRKPEPVTAELYVPPVAPKVEPAPTPEPPRPEAPKPEPPKPEPPKPEPPKPPVEPPKPPPRAERPPPDIAVKEKQERMKKEQAERERKEKEKEKQELDRKLQEKRVAEARERQAREAAALRAQAERERQVQQKAAADAAHAKADADYVRRIQAKIRGNLVVPPDLKGNPEAVFDVVQLPTGEIIDILLAKSSGVQAYDEAVQRAIMKSSPLPRPDAPDMFRRSLTLKFRPLD